MEESVRRLLSRLWLLQAAVFALLGYVPTLSGLNCYCYNEPNDGFPLCFFEDDMCSGADACYVHRELLNGVFYTTWNCLRESMNHIDAVCNQGAFNTDTEAYKCCKDDDHCNQGLQIVLPIERPQTVSTDAVTSIPSVATTVEVGSGSGSTSLLITEPTDTTLETTSRSTPASTSSTPIISRTSTQADATTSSTTRPQATSLKCFCSACPTNQSSCGSNSRCYVGKDFEPRQDVDGAAVVSPESYTWGCFSELEAATKCAETDKYSCCSDQDFCNKHLTPPPLKCFCSSNKCPDSQNYVSCGANTTCYVGLPSDSSSTTSLPDSLIWGCFSPSEAKLKCNDTHIYNCCSSGDNCNKDLTPPPRREEECTSQSGVCQTKAQLQNLLPVVIAITLSLTLIVIVLIILVLWVKIHNLKHDKPVNSSGSANSDSSENSVTTESESLPSPTSASSPHHHYLHVTTDEPAFGDSLKCNGSKA